MPSQVSDGALTQIDSNKICYDSVLFEGLIAATHFSIDYHSALTLLLESYDSFFNLKLYIRGCVLKGLKCHTLEELSTSIC